MSGPLAEGSDSGCSLSLVIAIFERFTSTGAALFFIHRGQEAVAVLGLGHQQDGVTPRSLERHDDGPVGGRTAQKLKVEIRVENSDPPGP